MATRVALIADTHLGDAAELPARCVELIAGSDLVLHAGDVSTAAALARIEAIGPPVRAVQGNVEDTALQRALPLELGLRVEAASFAIVHDAGPAAGRLERLRAHFPDADVVIFGHSHLPLHEIGDGLQIFNPGSPTQRRRARRRSIGFATVDGAEVRFEHVAL